MKKLLTILFIALSSCSKSQFIDYLLQHGATSNVVTNEKNVRYIKNFPKYQAFGFLDSLRTNRLCYYGRIGDSHTAGGIPYYMEYNIAADHWYDTVHINIPGWSGDFRDFWGVKMDNDTMMMFATQGTGYGLGPGGGYQSIDTKILRCDSNNVFSSDMPDFDYNVLGVRLSITVIFGNIVKGSSAGEYYAALYQVSNDSVRTRISVIKTTDYWWHYSEVGVVYDGTLDYSEIALGNFGNGKFVCLMRKNNAGTLTGYESSNYCATWTPKVASNLHWYIGGLPEIPLIYDERRTYADTPGDLDILYECRDSRFMMISMHNNVTDNFGTTIYQDPEMWSYNNGTGGNPSLGYGAMRRIGNNGYLILYGYEADNTHTYLRYSRTDLVTDTDGIPIAPPVIDTTVQAPTTTFFRVDIQGYTQQQLENIRYFSIDVSTSADFSSFSTLKYKAPTTAYPAVPIHDIRMLGLASLFNVATTGTRYYVRIKACNNAGCSDYTMVTVTTL